MKTTELNDWEVRALVALKLAETALNTVSRFRVPSLPHEYDDSYKIVSLVGRVVREIES